MRGAHGLQCPVVIGSQITTSSNQRISLGRPWGGVKDDGWRSDGEVGDGEPLRSPAHGQRSAFGFHSLASRCASAI